MHERARAARRRKRRGETVVDVEFVEPTISAPPTQIAMRATLLLSIAASALAETKSYAAAHAAHVAHSSAILSAPRRRRRRTTSR